MERRKGDDPKTESGPGFSGQFAAEGHDTMKLSFASTWLTQERCPVSRSNARMASLVSISTSVYESPVATYTSFRLASMVGEDQIAAPAGPCIWTPALFF